MENFDNPNPFENDERQRDALAVQSTETETRDHALSPATADRVRSRSTTSKSSRKSSKRAQSTGSTTEHPHLEKFKTAIDDVQTGVVDKVRTIGHKFHLDGVHAQGVSRFLNPTTIRMNVRYQSDSDSHGQPREGQELLWRARDNRKGRNSIAVPRLPVDDDDDASFLPLRYTPRMSSKLGDIAHNLYRMATTFPYWDMSFWSGSSYTIGSALFVADGALAWGPVAFGVGFESASADKLGGPLCFFIGALFYQVGAVAAYLEAVNDGSFHGSAMRRLLDGNEEDSKKLLDDKIHDFFSHVKPHRPHQNPDTKMPDVDTEAGWETKEDRLQRPGSIYPDGKMPASRRGGIDLGGDESQQSMYSTWRWWPTWRALREHHVYEIGYLACAIQLFGVTLYGVTAIVIIPGILTSLKPWQELAAFWVPQVVAALCFLISSTMFMLETQEKWWKPEPKVLGWWIGVWSTAGSVGFELIACFGIKALASGEEAHWAEYQSDLATMWGSSCYLIGSFLQWYEALNKNPIEELFDEPGEMKSSMVHPI
ncbi:hypothetical protein Slin14017_G055060 [Septoria linicola]|nr:hypothetical protein Slin14017_G055060 [Septoria linicola]